MSATFDQILENVSAYLQYNLDEGRRIIDVSPGVAALLSAKSVPLQSRIPAAGVKPPSPEPDVPRSPVQLELGRIAEEVAACRKCGLGETRRRPVPGQGAEQPEIMFVGEAPGEDEDRQGLAFVGAAGQLLTKMILAMGLRREEVFIANILKCRPPGNRTPQPDEMDRCIPFLKAQIALLKPKVIVALGGTAVRGLLHAESGITKMRGCWQTFEGIDVMPTFHPSYLLRNPAAKKEVWEDLQAVLRHLGKPIPDHKKARISNVEQGTPNDEVRS